MKMRCAVIAAGCVALAVAAESDPAEVLKRVTAKVLAREAALPNYTCVETVTRDYYDPALDARSDTAAAGRLPQSCAALTAPGLPVQRMITDRLRLDVTITRQGEIYSWAGASKFADGRIDQVVEQGPIGTGSFGALLAIIFHQDAKTFTFAKYLLDDHRSLMEYSFEVKKEDSQYQAKNGDSWISLGYTGAFQADPQTGDVVRIEVQTDELPPATHSCQTSTTMDYRLTRIGGREFLLPNAARQRFVSKSGEAVENTTNLSNCREYKGESTISFSPAPGPAEGDAAAGNRQLYIPAGLPFTFELMTQLDADTAAAGDRLTGRLVSALRDTKGKILAPVRAAVEGRIARIEIRHVNPTVTLFAIRLTSIEIGGLKTPLTASRKGGPLGVTREKMPIDLPFSWERNTGMFRLPGEHAVMKAGYRSDWLTAVAADAPQGSH